MDKEITIMTTTGRHKRIDVSRLHFTFRWHRDHRRATHWLPRNGPSPGYVILIMLTNHSEKMDSGAFTICTRETRLIHRPPSYLSMAGRGWSRRFTNRRFPGCHLSVRRQNVRVCLCQRVWYRGNSRAHAILPPEIDDRLLEALFKERKKEKRKRN